MCQRLVDEKTGAAEPLLRYLLRWALEAVTLHPSALLSVFCMAGCVWLYHDMSDLMTRQGLLITEQTKAYGQMIAELREVNVRLENLEKNR